MIADLYQVIELMTGDKSNDWREEIAVIERAIETIGRAEK